MVIHTTGDVMLRMRMNVSGVLHLGVTRNRRESKALHLTVRDAGRVKFCVRLMQVQPMAILLVEDSINWAR